MSAQETQMRAYFLEQPGQALVLRDVAMPEPGPGEALIAVEACGMCHTDLGYASGQVAPNHALPLVLGHEVVGKVIASPEPAIVGQRVIVPAVLPCGECDFCWAGRGNACPAQKMPGNDINGGFATHLVVPSRGLVPIDAAPQGLDVRVLGVVADAVSTAFQAVKRSGLTTGDVAFVVGAGGVGGYVAQIASAMGAKVVALDVSPARLEQIAAHGASEVVDVRGRPAKDIRKHAHGLARAWGVPSLAFRIFECSGTAAGQELAFTLLARAATLLVVGYTPDTVTLRLSNLMAFDATAQGSWGCPPEAYADVLRLLYEREVVIEPFVEIAPMSSVNALLDAMAAHALTRRMVLDPNL